MNKISYQRYSFFCLILAFGFATPFFIKKNKLTQKLYSSNELYNPKLLAFNSVSKAIHFLDYTHNIKPHQTFDTLAFVNSTSNFIKQRFSFGLANYSYTDNWIAALCADLFWEHFSAIVNPNDILKQQEGICSQQTMVFLEILKQKHVNVRSVGLGNQIKGPGHFICEVNYNGSWHLYDVTKEPNWNEIENKHFSMEYYIQNKELFMKIYNGKISVELLSLYLNEVSYGKPNQFPAKNMLLFHQVTYATTLFLPLFFLSLFFYFLYRNRNATL